MRAVLLATTAVASLGKLQSQSSCWGQHDCTTCTNIGFCNWCPIDGKCDNDNVYARTACKTADSCYNSGDKPYCALRTCPGVSTTTTSTTTLTTTEPQVFYHCTDGEQYNWPVFKDRTSLEQSASWSSYFQEAYGEIPTTGYPICTFSLTHLYAPLSRVGVTPPTQLSQHCPSNPGEYYSVMTDRQDVWSSWIWHPNLLDPYSGQPFLPAHTWVEVMHKAYDQDGDATWLYFAPGTAMWFNLGETRPYLDHDDAVSELLHQRCSDHQCVSQYPALYTAAKAAGLASVQFLKHEGMPCGQEKESRNMAVEILDLLGPGTFACGQEASGVTRYRAGWEASMPCDCDNSLDLLNCAGVGIRSNSTPSELLLF